MGRSAAWTTASAAATPAEFFVVPLLLVEDEGLDGDEEQAASITDSEQVRPTSRAARPIKNLLFSMFPSLLCHPESVLRLRATDLLRRLTLARPAAFQVPSRLRPRNFSIPGDNRASQDGPARPSGEPHPLVDG